MLLLLVPLHRDCRIRMLLVKPSKKPHITCITQTLRPRSFLLSPRIKGAKWCHVYILPQCLNRARHLQLLLHQKRGTAPASKRQDDIRVRGDSQTSDVFHGPAAETSRKRPLIDTSGADHETASHKRARARATCSLTHMAAKVHRPPGRLFS